MSFTVLVIESRWTVTLSCESENILIGQIINGGVFPTSTPNLSQTDETEAVLTRQSAHSKQG